MRVAVKFWGSVPGSVMKLRRGGCDLNVWRADTGRSVRRALDMVDGKNVRQLGKWYYTVRMKLLYLRKK